jgi:hypothetical protein
MTMLCASQDQIDVTFDNDGDLILTQTRWPDEDQTIIVSRDNIDVFIDKLTDAVGIPSSGRPAPTSHRFDHLVDDTERQESGFIDAVRTERPDLNIDKALADFDQKMGPKDPTAPVVAKSVRAAQAIKANPGKSDRAIAADIGVSHPTVAKARSELGGNNLPPERTGQDGKSYSVRQRISDDPADAGTTPLIPEFDLQNGGESTALTH